MSRFLLHDPIPCTAVSGDTDRTHDHEIASASDTSPPLANRARPPDPLGPKHPVWNFKIQRPFISGTEFCIAAPGPPSTSSGMSHLTTRRLENLTVSSTPTQARPMFRSWDAAYSNPTVRDAGGTPPYAHNNSAYPPTPHSGHRDNAHSYEQLPGG